jgi:hypothetical protein
MKAVSCFVVASLAARLLFAAASQDTLVNRVMSRAHELAGPASRDCGDSSSPAGEDCLLDAFKAKTPAIASFSVHGSVHAAAEAQLIGKDGSLVTVSAYSGDSGIVEKRCAVPVVVREYGQRRLRCKDNYLTPLGATTLNERPYLTTNDERPEILERPDIPASACPPSSKPVVAQLLIDETGHVPELRLLVVPPGCSTEAVVSTLKRWRYSPAKRNGTPVPNLLILTVSVPKTAA